MKVRISKSFLQGEIDAIPSKSYLHRILIAAALSESDTVIEGYINSADIAATSGSLERLGAKITADGNRLTVCPINKNSKANPEINCIESGSTLRFLIPVICALGNGGRVDGKEGLRSRPVKPLIDALKTNGARFDGDCLPLKIDGKINSGEYVIDGGISSQFISGLLFALPLLDGDSKITVRGELVSKGYVDITLEILELFGVKIVEQKYGYFVEGNQKFVSPKIVVTQGDWSNAAFFLAAGAINGDITLHNLKLNSRQGDSEIVEILEKMGAEISVKKSSVSVKKSVLKAVEIDAEDIPDLVPILSVLCSYAKGTSKIMNVSRLKLKESDRLSATMEMLKGFGIASKTEGDVLSVEGGKPLGNEFNGFNDHRMVMSEAVGAILTDGFTVINGSEAVRKSYPDFFEDFKKLGGNVNAADA